TVAVSSIATAPNKTNTFRFMSPSPRLALIESVYHPNQGRQATTGRRSKSRHKAKGPGGNGFFDLQVDHREPQWSDLGDGRRAERLCGARLACPLRVKFRLKSRPSLRTPGAPKVLRCLRGSLERCVSILCAHSDSRFDVRQTTAAGGSQNRGSRRFLVREFTNRHPIIVAEG